MPLMIRISLNTRAHSFLYLDSFSSISTFSLQCNQDQSLVNSEFMGNLSSCFFVEAQAGRVKLMDLHGNLRSIKLPMTAAELMLEEPGHFVSDIDELRSTSRFSAMKADEQLSMKKVYVLVPVVRLNCKLSESDMTLVELTCRKGRSKRHSSKVLPALVKESSEMPVRLPSRDNTCLLYSGRVRQWRPALASISEV